MQWYILVFIYRIESEKSLLSDSLWKLDGIWLAAREGAVKDIEMKSINQGRSAHTHTHIHKLGKNHKNTITSAEWDEIIGGLDLLDILDIFFYGRNARIGATPGANQWDGRPCRHLASTGVNFPTTYAATLWLIAYSPQTAAAETVTSPGDCWRILRQDFFFLQRGNAG